MKKLGFLVHDVLVHPVCGWCWILGLQRIGDWLHERSLFQCNQREEVWPDAP